MVIINILVVAVLIFVGYKLLTKKKSNTGGSGSSWIPNDGSGSGSGTGSKGSKGSGFGSGSGNGSGDDIQDLIKKKRR